MILAFFFGYSVVAMEIKLIWPFEGTYGVPSGSDVNGLFK